MCARGMLAHYVDAETSSIVPSIPFLFITLLSTSQQSGRSSSSGFPHSRALCSNPANCPTTPYFSSSSSLAILVFCSSILVISSRISPVVFSEGFLNI